MPPTAAAASSVVYFGLQKHDFFLDLLRSQPEGKLVDHYALQLELEAHWEYLLSPVEH
jgi:hypothetical protein